MIKFEKTTILIIILLVISLIFLIIYWRGTREGMENEKKAEISLFYADWCPYCKTAKPEWEDVKDKLDGKIVNGYTLMFREYNDKNKEMMDKYKIESFPTIKLKKDGEIYNFEAIPNKSNITQFINTTI